MTDDETIILKRIPFSWNQIFDEQMKTDVLDMMKLARGDEREKIVKFIEENYKDFTNIDWSMIEYKLKALEVE